MNIFVLDNCPRRAAQMQCDKHVVKMALESAQLLCCAHSQELVPYKHTHRNHPCAIWTRASQADYYWLYKHALALCEEYEFRFGKEHACKEVILNLPAFTSRNKSLFAFALAMPDEFKRSTAVKSYREYYKHKAKTIDFRYTNREVPDFLKAQ